MSERERERERTWIQSMREWSSQKYHMIMKASHRGPISCSSMFSTRLSYLARPLVSASAASRICPPPTPPQSNSVVELGGQTTRHGPPLGQSGRRLDKSAPRAPPSAAARTGQARWSNSVGKLASKLGGQRGPPHRRPVLWSGRVGLPPPPRKHNKQKKRSRFFEFAILPFVLFVVAKTQQTKQKVFSSRFFEFGGGLHIGLSSRARSDSVREGGKP